MFIKNNNICFHKLIYNFFPPESAEVYRYRRFNNGGLKWGKKWSINSSSSGFPLAGFQSSHAKTTFLEACMKNMKTRMKRGQKQHYNGNKRWLKLKKNSRKLHNRNEFINECYEFIFANLILNQCFGRLDRLKCMKIWESPDSSSSLTRSSNPKVQKVRLKRFKKH